MSLRAVLFALVVQAFTALPGAARQIDVPLHVDHEFVRQALLAAVYTSASGKAVVWDDGTGCGYLKLREPTVSTAGERLRVVTRGEARVGTPVGDQCLAPLQWDGFIEVFEAPQLSADQRVLQFRVLESNVYDREWKKRWVTGKLWDLVKQYVQPRFEAVRIDLNSATQDLRDLLPLLVGHGDSERIATLLDSLHFGAATVEDAGVAVVLSFAANPVTPVAAPTPEPTLSADELRRWEEAWERWDAFLTFVVKQIGHDTPATDLRQALSDVLIEARFDILEALAPSTPGAPDPTRALFLTTWERLAPVVRRSAATQPGTTALRYLSFMAAGDALAALDQAGPDVGLEISADGLRRLARIVAPFSPEDPLLYSTAVDPDLRQVLGFGAPLPAPDLSDAPDEAAWWQQLWPLPAALAAEPAPKGIERWVADADAIEAYLHAVREVLDDTTKQTVASGDLDARYLEVYGRLVLAAAWQESCWRQFVREHSKIIYLRSAVGSTGMMQVNEHVWRGLYDLRGLRWDIRYNGRAGTEILLHYLRDYAIAHHEDGQPGGIDNLARATYAVYNGGPGHLTRYRNKKTRKTLQRIDELFWQKYQAVRSGREAEVSRCIVGGQ